MSLPVVPECLKELRNLVKVPDWSTSSPEKLRAELLEEWINRWFVEVEFSQSVIDTKYLDSEYSDIIKLKLAQSLAEDIAETCATYKTQDKRITASMCAIRRKGKA